jgi:hypothetical protein
MEDWMFDGGPARDAWSWKCVDSATDRGLKQCKQTFPTLSACVTLLSTVMWCRAGTSLPRNRRSYSKAGDAGETLRSQPVPQHGTAEDGDCCERKADMSEHGLVPPEVLEAIRRQLCVPRGVLDVSVPEVVL